MARLFKETSHENGWPTICTRDKLQEDLWGKKLTDKVYFPLGIEIGRNGLIEEGFLLNANSFEKGVQLLIERENKIEEEDKFQRSISNVYNAVKMNDDKNKCNAEMTRKTMEEKIAKAQKKNEEEDDEEEEAVDDDEEDEELFARGNINGDDLFPDKNSDFDEGDELNDDNEDEGDEDEDDDFTPQNDRDADIADSLDDDFSI